MEKFASKLAERMIENGATSDKDIIAYGIECTMSEVIANIIVFTIAFIIGKPLEMLIWQAFWLPLRVNIGGHHANSHTVCLIYSTALAVGCVLVAPFIESWFMLIVVEVVATLIVAFFFAPFVHPNHPASQQHISRVRKIGIFVALVESALIILFFLLLPLWVSQTAALGMFSATALCIIAHLQQNFRNSHNNS